MSNPNHQIKGKTDELREKKVIKLIPLCVLLLVEIQPHYILLDISSV